jgi:dTDP-4-dehydrorhamnose reductase
MRMVETWTESPQLGLGETFHLAGSGVASWFGVAEFVMSECHKHCLDTAKVLPIRTADWPTKAVRPSNSILDSRKFEAAFGYTMPAWRESMSAVVARLADEAAALEG